MCSVTCTSYSAASFSSHSPEKSFNNAAFVDNKDEKEIDIDNGDEKSNNKQALGIENIAIDEKTDDQNEVKNQKTAETYRMHYKVGDVPAFHLTFLFGLQVSIMY
jgi:hypothetical protein